MEEALVDDELLSSPAAASLLALRQSDASPRLGVVVPKQDDVDETLREEDDDHDKDDRGAAMKESSKRQPQELNITVGGGLEKPALCLLDGIQEFGSDNDHATKKPVRRLTLPIARLPATLGRTHDQGDNADQKNYFVGMGSAKALSREHVRIEYRVPTAAGGCGQLQSEARSGSSTAGDLFYFSADDPLKTSDIVKSGGDGESLPETGFYAITCLGKNRIVVNKQRVEKGQTSCIRSGDAIRIGSFCLYFFTPLEKNDGAKAAAATMQVRDDVAAPVAGAAANKKRRLSLATGDVSQAVPSVAGQGYSVAGASSAPPTKRNSKTLQAECDEMSTSELLEQMARAIEANVWDRRHQLIGSTLSHRAVRAAARALSPLASENKGELSRSEIMDWISESDRFSGWVEHMLTKMESKSYQASITKALIKAGFTRTASTGRYIKWIVPAEMKEDADSEKGDNEEEDADRDQENDGDEGAKEEAGDSGRDESGDELDETGDTQDEESIADDNEDGNSADGGGSSDAGESGPAM